MTEDPTRIAPQDMLCFDVYAANLAFGRVYKPLLDPFGLTYPQYLVLLILWAEDGKIVGQIGAELGLESSTLTPLLKRLEVAGFVKRCRDTQDERRVRVNLTDTGRRLRDKTSAVPACVTQATGLDMTEMRDLQAKMRRLRRALQQSAQDTAP